MFRTSFQEMKIDVRNMFSVLDVMAKTNFIYQHYTSTSILCTSIHASQSFFFFRLMGLPFFSYLMSLLFKIMLVHNKNNIKVILVKISNKNWNFNIILFFWLKKGKIH